MPNSAVPCCVAGAYSGLPDTEQLLEAFNVCLYNYPRTLGSPTGGEDMPEEECNARQLIVISMHDGITIALRTALHLLLSNYPSHPIPSPLPLTACHCRPFGFRSVVTGGRSALHCCQGVCAAVQSVVRNDAGWRRRPAPSRDTPAAVHQRYPCGWSAFELPSCSSYFPAFDYRHPLLPLSLVIVSHG